MNPCVCFDLAPCYIIWSLNCLASLISVFGGRLQVDDVLQHHGIAASGDGAARGVTIKHDGLVLYPVDAEQLHASSGEVQVGAAFLLYEESDEESQSVSESSE